VPNALFTLRDLSIWDIIYEHCSYFSAGSLAYAFSESGFDVLEVREEYDGQFLSIAALPASSAEEWQREPWDGLEEMMVDVAAFGNHYRQKVQSWTERLDQMEQAGQKVVVWGAGSKGVMFLNSLPTSERISYVVDINPRKQGMFIAGSGQQIVAPEFLRDYRPDVIVMMNPIYKDEIQQMMQGFGVQAELVQA
jgi:threonine dehydrogenase-like Zn-dependent dehydrogenase